jgi:addiction module RelE/StbE family toxin
MVQIKITNKAIKDIKLIYKYILKDSYQNAILVTESIFHKIDTLKTKPDIGKLVREFKNPCIRELKLFKYRIIYRVKNEDNVEIITITHSSRLLSNLPQLKRYFKK